MTADALLSRLNRVKKVGPGRWKACCPVHGDRHPSLSVTEKDDGMVLVHCLSGGCGAMDVVGALGVDPCELFPPREIGHTGAIRNPIFKSDVFDLIRFECSLVSLIGCDMHSKKTISEGDYQRLGEAISKLERIAGIAYGS